MTSENGARCIVGGGPAGMMTAFLLAPAGVEVVVLEKHADFNRDFRGDTIHPSTLELMHELGLLEQFLKLPHQELREIRGVFNGYQVPMADFSRLPTRCKFIAFIPQWDFLNFLASHAKRFPTFALHMQHEVIDLLFDNRRVVGVRAKTPDGEREFRADLVIGADGQPAITHARVEFELRDFGAPIDALWMRLPKRAGDPAQSRSPPQIRASVEKRNGVSRSRTDLSLGPLAVMEEAGLARRSICAILSRDVADAARNRFTNSNRKTCCH